MSLADFTSRFAALAPRERRALLSLAAFVVFAVFFQLLWSAFDTIRELRRTLPELQARVETARALERRVGELRAKTEPIQLEGELLRARCVELAHSMLPGLPAGAIVGDGARGIALEATVPFAAWVEYAALLQLELTLRLVRAEIVPAAEAGRVRVKARLILADATT